MPDPTPIDPSDAEMDMVMPFVVCASNGGLYDDGSFVAGVRFGRLDAELAQLQDIDGANTLAPGFPVQTALVPQLDLLAMSRGYRLDAVPVPGMEDEWTQVTFTAGVASTGGPE